MAKQPDSRAKLRVKAKHIGPIMNLDAELSDRKQHLIFARNGTGKSFIARSLRLLDPTLEQQEPDAEIPSILISEEAQDGRGSFGLYEGETCVGSFDLNAKTANVDRSNPKYIFHVFSEDFIEAHVRNKLHGLDGNISHEIIIGKENLDIEKKSAVLENKKAKIIEKKTAFNEEFETEKASIKANFGIAGSLGSFKKLDVGDYFSEQGYTPPKIETTLDELQKKYDLYKSFPSEPELPEEISVADIFPDTESISAALAKVTSPSTVAEAVKNKIREDPAFFRSGVRLMKDDEKCPFCTQNLSETAVEAIDAYTAYFADEEAKHINELQELNTQLERLSEAVSKRQAMTLRASKRFNDLKKYFPSVADVSANDLATLLNGLEAYITVLQQSISAKKSSSLSEEIELPLCADAELFEKIMEQAEANQKLYERIASLASNSSSERLKIQNDCCEALSVKIYQDRLDTINEIKTLTKEVSELETEIAELQKTHGGSAKAKERVVETFQLMLKHFFSDTYTFDEETFSVGRKRKEIARGPDRTLSDGEKSVIAFCYYIARIHLRVGSLPDYEKVFLIIDDPVSSLSFDYIYGVAQALKYVRISEDGEILMSLKPQLIRPRMIMLTHNNYFYNVAGTNNVVKGEGLFQLIRSDDKHDMRNQKAFATPHMLQLRDVVDVSSGKKKPDHTTPNSIRSVVEGMWKFCCPNLPNFEDFVKYLISDLNLEIKSVLLNDLCHGGKFSDPPHREEEIIAASTEALKIVEKFAEGQLKTC